MPGTGTLWPDIYSAVYFFSAISRTGKTTGTTKSTAPTVQTDIKCNRFLCVTCGLSMSSPHQNARHCTQRHCSPLLVYVVHESSNRTKLSAASLSLLNSVVGSVSSDRSDLPQRTLKSPDPSNCFQNYFYAQMTRNRADKASTICFFRAALP